jgi:hypothetical protein
MTRKKFIAILLHLIIASVRETICDDESLMSNSNNNNNNNSSSIETNDHLLIMNEEWQQECMKKWCPIGKAYPNFIFEDHLPSSVLETRQIHIALLLPSKPQTDQINAQTLSAILPVIDHAIENVRNLNLLKGYELVIHPRDTKCSSTLGPMAAFDLHSRNHADVFLGPICDYVLAPVARYAGVWKKPVISTGGLAAAFNYKVSVTRIENLRTLPRCERRARATISRHFKRQGRTS